MKEKLKSAYHRVSALLHKINFDAIAAYSARATLFIVISFFPFMIMLFASLRFLPFTEADLSKLSLDFIPDTIQDLMGSMIAEINNNTGAAILPLAAITALWSASTGVVSLIKGLNVVYKRTETRNYFAVRGMCMLYTLAFVVILLVVLAVLVFGNSLYQWIKQLFPVLQNSASAVISLRSIVALVVLTLFFTLLYNTVPNRKARWYGELPGAVLTAISWMAFSYLYSVYIDRMGTFSHIYGSLTAVVLLLIWLYSCMYILFIGAQINVLLQESRKGNYFLKSKPITIRQRKLPKKRGGHDRMP